MRPDRRGPRHDPARRGGADLREHRGDHDRRWRARRGRRGVLGGGDDGGAHDTAHAAAPDMEAAPDGVEESARQGPCRRRPTSRSTGPRISAVSEKRGGTWIPMAIVLGAFYALVGIVFAIPSGHVRFWRLAAWGVCAVAYAAHVTYERLALRRSSLISALHVALAAALGAFGLAVGAIAHSLSIPSSSHHRDL